MSRTFLARLEEITLYGPAKEFPEHEQKLLLEEKKRNAIRRRERICQDYLHEIQLKAHALRMFSWPKSEAEWLEIVDQIDRNLKQLEEMATH